MPTTFNVFSLGNLADMDTTEGNTTAENASALVGLTFGGLGDPLFGYAQSLSIGTGGTGGGTANAYDQDNSPNENFRIDGGANQTFDSSVVFNATLNYTDGTTATITAVIFQDTAGNTYLAPEFSANADMTALEGGAIRSMTLDSLVGNSYLGMASTRESFDFVTCFTPGARIATPLGHTKVEHLKPGDRIQTRDKGAQTIRWISRATRRAKGTMAPVRIKAGALGKNTPERDLVVSPQHRMLVSSRIAERMFGIRDVFVPAVKLLALPGVERDTSMLFVTYIHLLLDSHEVIFAEGAPTESLLTGPMTSASIGEDALAELSDLFPDLIVSAATPARATPKGHQIRRLMQRHVKNRKPVIQD